MLRLDRILALLQSKLIKIVLVVTGLLLCGSHTVSAQSTVFNIPSTDVLSRGEGYFEADFSAHLSSYESGGYQLYGPRIVYGLGKRTEIGLNAFYTHSGTAEPIELQPNFKWKFLENKDNGLGAAAGVLVFIPITERSSSASRAQVYAVISKDLKRTGGPRFTAGAYGLIGLVEEGTAKQGVLLGYEHPLGKKLLLQADWSSGNNDFGYLSAGVGINLTTNGALYIGYSVGNQGRGNNYLGVFYGISF